MKQSVLLLASMLVVVCADLSAQSVEDSLLFNFQGKLGLPGSTSLDTTVGMQFRLYNADGSLTPWSESHASVDVQNGVFNVVLGRLVAFNDTMLIAGKEIGVRVGGDSEMTDRVPLRGAPFLASKPIVVVRDTSFIVTSGTVQCPIGTIPFQGLGSTLGTNGFSNSASSVCSTVIINPATRNVQFFCGPTDTNYDLLVFCVRRNAASMITPGS